MHLPVIFPPRRALAAGLVFFLSLLARADLVPALRFDFGSGPAAPNFTKVLPDMVYTDERGFGFEPGATLTTADRGGSDRQLGDFITSTQPFFFSVRVPSEGNYRVTVTLGDQTGESITTIKAELRRLMVEQVHTMPGHFSTPSLIVNIRNPRITATGDIKAGEVKLKAPRETTQEALDWDNRLTLEFNGARPVVGSIQIVKVVDVPTIFLLGDSTVCDQWSEPYNSWGQMLPRFFAPDIAVANHGESGETYRDSLARRRLDKILSLMKPGDYLLMQFGHNDQKQMAAGTGGPFTTYKAEIRQHVEGVRAHGGIPVIISPMERRKFDRLGKIIPSLTDYAEASRQAAQELKVAFIDLHAMSIPFYEALGPDRAYLAFAGTGTERDATHHNNYGSYELAKCVVQGIRQAKLRLAEFIIGDFHGFDPAHPDPIATFDVPPSPQFTNQRPLGE